MGSGNPVKIRSIGIAYQGAASSLVIRPMYPLGASIAKTREHQSYLEQFRLKLVCRMKCPDDNERVWTYPMKRFRCAKEQIQILGPSEIVEVLPPYFIAG